MTFLNSITEKMTHALLNLLILESSTWELKMEERFLIYVMGFSFGNFSPTWNLFQTLCIRCSIWRNITTKRKSWNSKNRWRSFYKHGIFVTITTVKSLTLIKTWRFSTKKSTLSEDELLLWMKMKFLEVRFSQQETKWKVWVSLKGFGIQDKRRSIKWK